MHARDSRCAGRRCGCRVDAASPHHKAATPSPACFSCRSNNQLLVHTYCALYQPLHSIIFRASQDWVADRLAALPLIARCTNRVPCT